METFYNKDVYGWQNGEHFMENIQGRYFQLTRKANLSIPNLLDFCIKPSKKSAAISTCADVFQVIPLEDSEDEPSATNCKTM